MTQHDDTHAQKNDSPSTSRRRRSSGAARTGSQSSPAANEQPLAPVPSSSFYEATPRLPPRQPLHAIRTSDTRDRQRLTDGSHAMEVDIQPKATKDPPVVGIDLDADDTQFPPSPLSVDDDIAQFGTTRRYPAVATMQLEGHGYLPNAILGHSSHPAFHLGAAFEWPESFHVRSLVDYTLNPSYTPRPSPSRTASEGLRPISGPSARSYSQALGSDPPTTTASAADSDTTTIVSPDKQPSGSTSTIDQGSGSACIAFSTASLEQARPHPNAYYSVADQAWTVIAPIPKDALQDTRALPVSGQCHVLQHKGTKRTHHYVRMPQAIDPKCILRMPQQENNPVLGLQQDLLAKHTLGGPSSASFPNPADPSDPYWKQFPTPSHECWDVYVCSGCRNAFAVSPPNVIQSILGFPLCQSFAQARIAEEQQKPQPLGDDVVIQSALEYLWKILRNLLYDNNRLGIPTLGTTFTKRLGKNSVALALFERLHFTVRVSPDGKPMLNPPVLTPQVVLVLSRAFLELSLWIASLEPNPPITPAAVTVTKPQTKEVFDLLNLNSFKKALERVTGPDITEQYVPSGDQFHNAGAFAIVYKVLGVTPETGDEDIAFAYTCQMETDARNQLFYLDALSEIANLRGDHREVLQVLIATERSQDRFGYTEIVRALAALNLKPKDHPTHRFFNYPISEWPDEDAIASAYHESKERVPQRQGSESDLKELKDAVTLLAKATRSELLQAVIESASPAKPTIGEMTVEEAFTYLQVSKELSDNFLCSAVSFMFFTDDTASEFQKEKARVALNVIAEDRKSSGIKQFLENGVLPEAVEAPREAPVGIDRPAGLQNIGNTCYLNSLLQYFFTIRELREVVLDFDKYQETRPFEEIEISKRVGGRQITQREIERSRKFTKLLSQLFYDLIHEKVASVRPTRDLAYLALVSSKDEDATSLSASQQASEGAEVGENLTTTGMKVDDEPMDQPTSSLVSGETGEEGLAAAQSIDSARSDKLGSPSVLGKRTSDHFDEVGGRMDVDADASGTVVGSLEGTATAEQPSAAPADAGMNLMAQEGGDGAVDGLPAAQAQDPSEPHARDKGHSPPPLPPRTSSTTIAETNMMFGRQNDVSEAMDNVIFQIESALDDSKIPRSSESPTLAGKPCSFVQSLFYGSTLQTLEFETEEEGRRVKEETFGYQLVDVAKDGTDLYDGLDAAFEPSTVEIEGKKAKRQDILTQLPPILQIQLQRVQFDRSASRIYKSNAYMPFPETLRMGKYLSPEGRSPEFAAKQSRTSHLRSELTKLQTKLVKLEQKDEDQQTLPDMLNNAADSLRQISQMENMEEDVFMQQLRETIGDNEENLLALLPQHASAIDKDILEAKERLAACRREIEEIWSDDVENEYELSSVFIHLGAAGYGHYYLYQRALPHQPERWLKFNDESVTDVEVSEVFADTTGSTANPYWLTYVRKSEIPRRIDAVCRNFV